MELSANSEIAHLLKIKSFIVPKKERNEKEGGKDKGKGGGKEKERERRIEREGRRKGGRKEIGKNEGRKEGRKGRERKILTSVHMEDLKSESFTPG
jgi:hypothetical protein